MAIAPPNEDAFLREVDDELRRDQLTGFWRRWGRWLVIGIVAALALLGGFLYWQHRQRVEAGVRSEAMVKALDQLSAGNLKAARPALDEMAAAGGGYGQLGRMTIAAGEEASGEPKRAVAAYAAIAGDAAVDEPLRQLALLRQTAAEFETLPPATVIARLQPLATPGSPWLGSAGEMVAVSYLKLNQPQRAAPILAAIAKADGVPATIKGRVSRLATGLGADAAPLPKDQVQ